jgi:tRNA(Arg) A34 adenosine deaminase TadA
MARARTRAASEAGGGGRSLVGAVVTRGDEIVGEARNASA